MKLRLALITIIFTFIAVYGWRFYARAFTNYNDLKCYEDKIIAYNNEATTLHSEIEECASELNAPQQNQIYDFVSKFNEDGFTVLSVSGKKLVGSSTTTIATTTDLNELHNWAGIDILDIAIESVEYTEFLEYLENSYIHLDKLVIYPIDNTVIISVVMLGGV